MGLCRLHSPAGQKPHQQGDQVKRNYSALLAAIADPFGLYGLLDMH